MESRHCQQYQPTANMLLKLTLVFAFMIVIRGSAIPSPAKSSGTRIEVVDKLDKANTPRANTGSSSASSNSASGVPASAAVNSATNATTPSSSSAETAASKAPSALESLVNVKNEAEVRIMEKLMRDAVNKLENGWNSWKQHLAPGNQQASGGSNSSGATAAPSIKQGED